METARYWYNMIACIAFNRALSEFMHCFMYNPFMLYFINVAFICSSCSLFALSAGPWIFRLSGTSATKWRFLCQKCLHQATGTPTVGMGHFFPMEGIDPFNLLGWWRQQATWLSSDPHYPQPTRFGTAEEGGCCCPFLLHSIVLL